jgi:hypothetical protein
MLFDRGFNSIKGDRANDEYRHGGKDKDGRMKRTEGGPREEASFF